MAGKRQAAVPVSPQGISYSELDHFVNADGLRLFKKTWIGNSNPIKAAVLVVHGYGEHCLRWERLADELNPAGIAVYAHDHVGHGQSEGTRVDVEDFHVFARDVLQHAEAIKEEHPHLPLFLFGHSMGGTIALTAILAAVERPTFFTGLILSAPGIQPDPATATPIKVFLAKTLAWILPQLQVGRIPDHLICRDQTEFEKYNSDPLVWHGGVKARMGYQMLNAWREIRDNMATIQCPLLVLHGTGDRLALISGSRMLVEKAKSTDKQLKEYEGYYHALPMEPEPCQRIYFKDIFDWIKERI